MNRGTAGPPPVRRRRWMIALGVVVIFAAIVVIGQLSLSGNASGLHPERSGSSASDAPTEGNPAGEGGNDSPLVRREADDPMAEGELDAPVVLTEWVDRRCPFCAAFHRETLPTIIDEYVDKGLVRIETNAVSYFGEKAAIPDMDRFAADLDDPALRAATQESTQWAQQIGVSAVPFFVAGDVALSGAQSTEIFRQFLDQAIEKTG